MLCRLLDRCHTDDGAEHGQSGAHFVGGQRTEGDLETLVEL